MNSILEKYITHFRENRNLVFFVKVLITIGSLLLLYYKSKNIIVNGEKVFFIGVVVSYMINFISTLILNYRLSIINFALNSLELSTSNFFNSLIVVLKSSFVGALFLGPIGSDLYNYFKLFPKQKRLSCFKVVAINRVGSLLSLFFLLICLCASKHYFYIALFFFLTLTLALFFMKKGWVILVYLTSCFTQLLKASTIMLLLFIFNEQGLLQLEIFSNSLGVILFDSIPLCFKLMGAQNFLTDYFLSENSFVAYSSFIGGRLAFRASVGPLFFIKVGDSLKS